MNKSFLTFEYIDKFKGILIILIVAGHIKGLTSLTGQALLYSFHVSSFLFLPFLFNNDRLTLHNIMKIFRRYYVPYTLFFIISYIAYSVVFHSALDIKDVFFDWMIGTSYTLKVAIGIGAYWFFPALIALLIFIMIYNSISSLWKKVFIVFSFLVHISVGIFSYPNEIFSNFPFDIYIPLYLFFLGFIIKNIISTIELNKQIFIITTILFITSLIVSYDSGKLFNLAVPYFPNIITKPLDFILHDIIMLSGFFTILFISKYIPFLAPFGKYSIAIYTLHPLIAQIINLALRSENLLATIIKFLIVLGITLIIVHTLYKFNIDKLIYPK